jgi:hypothetical protein
MIAPSLPSKLVPAKPVLAKVVDVASFPSKPGCPKQKEAACEGHLRINSGE